MIKYTTKDIVNRATQLADLENSDFISWNENINLLNESWQKIYQQLIDNGDKTFIKEITVTSDKVIKLPCDFYELFSVELVPSCTQIPRKAKSESERGLGYDIINDELVLYGLNTENIRIRYLPTPQTLTLKNKTMDINSNVYNDSDYKAWDCFKNRYIYSNYNTTNTVKIFSTDANDVVQTFTYGTTPLLNAVVGRRNSSAIICENGIQIKTPNNTKNIPLISTDKACLLKHNDEVGAVKISGTVVIIYVEDKEYTFDINDRTNKIEEIGNINLDNVGMATIRFYEENRYSLIVPIVDSVSHKCSYNQIDVYINGDDLYVTKITAFESFNFGLSTDVNRKSYLNVVDGKTCLATKDYFYVNDYIMFSFDDYSLIGVNEINNDNGYGISIIDSYNTNHVMLHSVFIDTALLYPNNVYFNFMSVLMAISYKIKQSGDVTLLSAKLDEMESQYFDTLQRDVNNVVRITNVY